MQKFQTCAVVGRKTERMKRFFSRHFKINSKKPDFIVSYGGDGTILHSERLYSGVPKLALRHHRKCSVCSLEKTKTPHKATEKVYCDSALEQIMEGIKTGRFSIQEFDKIQATAFVRKNGRKKKTTLVGLNEVQIHNSNHIHAVRFDFCLNGVCLNREIVGDGIVASTAYGSTAYFYAITRKKFNVGFGIAFNNTIAGLKPVFLKKHFEIAIHIHRRNALLIADNNPKMVALKEGDKVLVTPAKDKARMIKLKG
ncbi:MAG: hypothetical protein V1717_02215 [Candidatus Micrarchaeota archaeon]